MSFEDDMVEDGFSNEQDYLDYLCRKADDYHDIVENGDDDIYSEYQEDVFAPFSKMVYDSYNFIDTTDYEDTLFHSLYGGRRILKNTGMIFTYIYSFKNRCRIRMNALINTGLVGYLDNTTNDFDIIDYDNGPLLQEAFLLEHSEIKTPNIIEFIDPKHVILNKCKQYFEGTSIQFHSIGNSINNLLPKDIIIREHSIKLHLLTERVRMGRVKTDRLFRLFKLFPGINYFYVISPYSSNSDLNQTSDADNLVNLLLKHGRCLRRTVYSKSKFPFVATLIVVYNWNDNNERYYSFNTNTISIYNKNSIEFSSPCQELYLEHEDYYYIDDSKQKKIGWISYDLSSVYIATDGVKTHFREGLAFKKKDNLYYLIDITNKTIVPPIYENVQGFSEGLAAVQDRDSHLWGYINQSGEEIIKPRYIKCTPFKNGIARVLVKIMQAPFWIDDLWMNISKNGSIIVGRHKHELSSNCEYAIDLINDSYLYRQNGKTVIVNDNEESFELDEQFKLIKALNYINEQGENKICIYQGLILFVFTKELFPLIESDNYDFVIRKQGLINERGDIILPPICEIDDISKDGLVKFQVDLDTYGWSNPLCYEVFTLNQIHDKQNYLFNWDSDIWPETIFPFSNGMRAVQRNTKWGFEDSNYHLVIDCIFDCVWAFEEYQNPIISPEINSNSSFFAAIVMKDGMMGCIDLNGNYIIELNRYYFKSIHHVVSDKLYLQVFQKTDNNTINIGLVRSDGSIDCIG